MRLYFEFDNAEKDAFINAMNATNSGDPISTMLMEIKDKKSGKLLATTSIDTDSYKITVEVDPVFMTGMIEDYGSIVMIINKMIMKGKTFSNGMDLHTRLIVNGKEVINE